MLRRWALMYAWSHLSNDTLLHCVVVFFFKNTLHSLHLLYYIFDHSERFPQVYIFAHLNMPYNMNYYYLNVNLFLFCLGF